MDRYPGLPVMAMKAGRVFLRRLVWKILGKLTKSVTVRRKQGTYTVLTQDYAIGRSLYVFGEHEYEFSVRCLKLLLEQGYIPRDERVVLLDIGANIGIIGIGLIRSGMVAAAIAMEPEPRNFALLQRNVAQNNLSDKIVCVQCAASASVGTLSFELAGWNLGDHRVRARSPLHIEVDHESGRKSIKVQSIPLDDLESLTAVRAASLPGFRVMWIDVQGHEGFVFKGATKLLRDGMPTIAEIWPYGILRSGMSLSEFCEVISARWSHFYLERRGRFIKYPLSIFPSYLDELGSDEAYGNVIFVRDSQ